jgi:predicted alpha/beta hydrolase
MWHWQIPLLILHVFDVDQSAASGITRLAYKCTLAPPQTWAHKSIGHFGFFPSRFRATLWKGVVDWLRNDRG